MASHLAESVEGSRCERLTAQNVAIDSGSYRHFLRRNPAFRRLWLSQLVSQTGDRASAVALLGLVLGLTGSGFLAGAILAANLLSPLLVFPVVSAVVDRLPRQRLMVAAHLMAAAMALAMTLVLSSGTVWVGIAAVLGVATMNAFSRPASQAALPNLVDAPDLGRANALLASTQGITLGIGPVVGGVGAAYVGHDAVFVANAVSFVLAAILVVSIRGRFAEAARGPAVERALGQVREGLAYVRSDAPTRYLVAIKALFALAGGGAFVLLPVFATRVFSAGEVGIGVLMAARGMGALIGPFLARAVVGENESRLFVVLGACAGLFGGAYALFAATPVIWLALPLVTIAHIGGFALWTMESYGLQRTTPDQLRGRVFALDFTLASALMALSMLATGRLVESVDARVLMVAESVILIACAGAWTVVTRRFWRPARGGADDPTPGTAHEPIA